MSILFPALGLIFGYLMGSVPYGLVITRLAGLGDIRDIGSGNIGATNVLRTGRTDLALLTFLGDSFKGTVAILLMKLVSPEAAVLAGLGAFLGHLFPVWLRFKGGKGVATYIGVLLGLNWMAAALFCAIWLVMALVFRISSLSALTAALVLPLVILAGLLGSMAGAWVFPILSMLVFITHRANIQRLLAGTEPRIGAKKPAAGSGAGGN